MRRRSLPLGLAPILAAVLLGGLATGCRTPSAPALSRFEFSRPEMGMPFRIVLYAATPAQATNAVEAAFDRIAVLNAELSDYEDDSELTRLSHSSGSGAWVAVGDDLWRVLVHAQRVAEQSGGAFDITVGPLVQQWRRARRERELPPPAQLAAALRAVGWQKVELDHRHRRVRLLVPKMRLDLGGIAKGFALQEAFEVLRHHGVSRALVTGGGDMVAGDPPPGRTGWRIELAPLDVPNAPPPRYVQLRRMALVTSGDLYQRVEIDGVRYSHIVDPHTGMGLTDHSLVTLIAPDGMTADALSKVVAVLGPVRGTPFVEAEPGAAAQVVRQPAGQLEFAVSRRLGAFLEPADPPTRP